MHPAGDARPRTTFGRLVRIAKWPVLILWVAMAVWATPAADRIDEVQADDSSAYLPEGYDSTEVAMLEEAVETGPDQQSAVAIYSRESGRLTATELSAIGADHDQLAGMTLPRTSAPTSVVESEDGRAAMFSVTVTPEGEDDSAVHSAVESMRDITSSTEGEHPALQAYVAGEAGLDVDTETGDVDMTLLLTSMAIVAVLLLLTYRSPVLWLVPLLVGAAAVQVARATTYELASAGLTVTELSVAILIVLVFGAGTDYAMLLLNRYREELAHYYDRNEAVAEAVRRTLPALLASAGTVIAGMLCLLAASLAGLRGLGPVAVVGVGVALLAMLTLLPALLACTGRWVMWPRTPYPSSAAVSAAASHRFWSRISVWVSGHFRPVAVTVIAMLGIGAVGLTGLETSSDPLDKVPPHSESVAGTQQLREHFEAGSGSPVRVVLPADAGDDDREAMRDAVQGDGVHAVSTGDPIGDRPTLDVELAVDSYTDAGAAAIDDLRARVDDVTPAALVGGAPVEAVDYLEAAVDDTVVIVPLVLVAVTVLLALLLRSLVAPVMLLASIALSFAASLGAATWIFHHVMGYGGVAGDLFVYIFVFLVALGVDYIIFLMERIREERRHGATTQAVERGLTSTGGVITAAGMVLAGTFMALVQLPDVTVAQVGLAVALGVLVDTLLVRSLLVPSVVIWLGDRTWWPSRTGRDGGHTGRQADRAQASPA